MIRDKKRGTPLSVMDWSNCIVRVYVCGRHRVDSVCERWNRCFSSSEGFQKTLNSLGSCHFCRVFRSYSLSSVSNKNFVFLSESLKNITTLAWAPQFKSSFFILKIKFKFCQRRIISGDSPSSPTITSSSSESSSTRSQTTSPVSKESSTKSLHPATWTWLWGIDPRVRNFRPIVATSVKFAEF